MKGPEFLKAKYNLHNTPEVDSAVKRDAKRIQLITGKTFKISQKPTELIEKYLDRFQEIIRRKNPSEIQHGIDALKRLLHTKLIIKPEEVPESTFLLEQRIAREQGHGNIEITDEFRQRKTEQIVNNQTQSLDKWIDYLASHDSNYEDWAKYWAFRSITEMGKLEKKEDEQGREVARFQKRNKDTVASFPPLNPRALAMTISVLRSKLGEKAKPKKEQLSVKNESIKLDDKEFQDLISTENFSKIYSQFLIEMPEYSTEGLQETRGEWVKYSQGSDATALVKSLQGYPLEWCTAEFDTAQTQLQGGDFYVYYSLNQDGTPNIPRVAIRMENDSIVEVRGIAPDQNVDPYISPVVQEKMKEFPDGEEYKKKSKNMEFLTAIESKVRSKQELTRDELVFLYEIDSKIEGFGYAKDPRVEELQSQRDIKKDLSIIFGCVPQQIAFGEKEISKNTKVYFGNWDPGVLKLLPRDVTKVYRRSSVYVEELSAKEIFMCDVEFNPDIKDIKTIEEVLLQNGYFVSDLAKKILTKTPFSEERKQLKLVAFSLADLNLNFVNGARKKEVFEEAERLGLKLCPIEVVPQIRLGYKNQSVYNECLWIAMKPIDLDGSPYVLTIDRYDDGSLWLDATYTSPNHLLNSSFKFIFMYP